MSGRTSHGAIETVAALVFNYVSIDRPDPPRYVLNMTRCAAGRV